MELLHQYYYSKGKVVTKAILYTLLSALLVGPAVIMHMQVGLSYLFTEWQGWVIAIVYSLFTLGVMLSAVENYGKAGMAFRGVPAFGVGADHFVVFNARGATKIPFEECEQVRFKTTYHYRGLPATLTLIIIYHDKFASDSTSKVEIKLSELDRPQHEIDQQLNKVYKQAKKNSICDENQGS